MKSKLIILIAIMMANVTGIFSMICEWLTMWRSVWFDLSEGNGRVYDLVRTQRGSPSTIRRCFSFIFWALGKTFWKKSNKNIINDWHSKKWTEDPLYRLTFSIRNSIRESIIKSGFTKNSKTHIILGCSFEEFKLYFCGNVNVWFTSKLHPLHSQKRN